MASHEWPHRVYLGAQGGDPIWVSSGSEPVCGHGVPAEAWGVDLDVFFDSGAGALESKPGL